MRSLVELQDGHLTISTKNTERGIVKSYGPTKNPNTPAGMLFGVVGDDQRPSRLIVRDCKFSDKNPEFTNIDLPYTETKTEVSIDRITSKANPRTFERVPAGAIFDLKMVLNIFDEDNEELLKQTVQRAINLLEDDYLGGHGSRGYGQIIFKIDKDWTEKTIADYQK